jgi:hypothetical protein
MIPNDHESVFRKENNPNKAVKDTKIWMLTYIKTLLFAQGYRQAIFAISFVSTVQKRPRRADLGFAFAPSELKDQNGRSRADPA